MVSRVLVSVRVRSGLTKFTFCQIKPKPTLGEYIVKSFFLYHCSEGAKGLKGPARVKLSEPFLLG